MCMGTLKSSWPSLRCVVNPLGHPKLIDGDCGCASSGALWSDVQPLSSSHAVQALCREWQLHAPKMSCCRAAYHIMSTCDPTFGRQSLADHTFEMVVAHQGFSCTLNLLPTGKADDLDTWMSSLAPPAAKLGSRQVQRQASAKGSGLTAAQAAALELQVRCCCPGLLLSGTTCARGSRVHRHRGSRLVCSSDARRLAATCRSVQKAALATGTGCLHRMDDQSGRAACSRCDAPCALDRNCLPACAGAACRGGAGGDAGGAAGRRSARGGCRAGCRGSAHTGAAAAGPHSDQVCTVWQSMAATIL
jgi:hypothetical protein